MVERPKYSKVQLYANYEIPIMNLIQKYGVGQIINFFIFF
jgi:hypothetical protein